MEVTFWEDHLFFNKMAAYVKPVNADPGPQKRCGSLFQQLHMEERGLLHWQTRSLCLLAALTALSLVKSISHEGPKHISQQQVQA